MIEGTCTEGTHEHSGDIVRELLGYDGEGGRKEGGVAHSFHYPDGHAEREE